MILLPGTHKAHINNLTLLIAGRVHTAVLQVAAVGEGNLPSGTPLLTSVAKSFTSTGVPQTVDIENLVITAAMNGKGVFATIFDGTTVIYSIYQTIPNTNTIDLIGVPTGSGGTITWD